MTFAKARAAINENGVDSVTVTFDGTIRGVRNPNPPTNGIYIRRDGGVLVGTVSADVNIILEGGNRAWDGALSNDHHDPGMSAAQAQMYTILIKYCRAVCGSKEMPITNLGE